MLLNLLHRRLRVQWSVALNLAILRHFIKMQKCSRDDRPELIQPGGVGDGFAGVLGVTGKAEGLGAVERDREARLAGRMCVGARESSLFRRLGLGVLWCGCSNNFSSNRQLLKVRGRTLGGSRLALGGLC